MPETLPQTRDASYAAFLASYGPSKPSAPVKAMLARIAASSVICAACTQKPVGLTRDWWFSRGLQIIDGPQLDPMVRDDALFRLIALDEESDDIFQSRNSDPLASDSRKVVLGEVNYE